MATRFAAALQSLNRLFQCTATTGVTEVRQTLDFSNDFIQSYSYEVYRGKGKLYWYDSYPHSHIPELAVTDPNHNHIPHAIESRSTPCYEGVYEKGTRELESLCAVHPGQICYSVVAPRAQGKSEAHRGARGPLSIPT
jgi:hypothetical protein